MMTTTAHPVTVVPTHDIRPVRHTALIAVEFRKLLDTRASVWIQAVVFALCLAVTVATLALPPEARTLHTFAGYSGAVISVLMPVIAILALTSEWANGSIVTSAVLVPQRWRTVAAKFVALIVFATLWTAIALALAVVATLFVTGVGAGPSEPWDLSARDIATYWLGVTLSTIMGAAFGAVFMNPAVAIVVYLVLPVAWSVTGQLLEAVGDLSQWLDSSVTFSHLLDGSMDTAQSWWEVAASVGVWVLAPLVVGLVRLSRREIQ